MSRTLVVGVIGGIASGKSAVAEILQRWGAACFDADQRGHQTLRQPEVVEQLKRRWGPSILDRDGQPDRSAIAARVFDDSPQGRDDLRFLNSVTHPPIRAEFEQTRKSSQAPVLLLDAALLVEARWDRWCDEVLFVDASDEQRRRRAAARGWSTEHWQDREASQMPLEEKKQHATRVIDNRGTLADLAGQLRQPAKSWGLQPDMPAHETHEAP